MSVATLRSQMKDVPDTVKDCPDEEYELGEIKYVPSLDPDETSHLKPSNGRKLHLNVKKFFLIKRQSFGAGE